MKYSFCLKSLSSADTILLSDSPGLQYIICFVGFSWFPHNYVTFNDVYAFFFKSESVKWCDCLTWCSQILKKPFLSFRSTISSGPSQHSRYMARSGKTWLFLSPRGRATSPTTSRSTLGTSRCQSSLFTYSVSSQLLTAGLFSQLCQCSGFLEQTPILCELLIDWLYV